MAKEGTGEPGENTGNPAEPESGIELIEIAKTPAKKTLAQRIRLSSLSKKESGVSEKERLQGDALRPIIGFFIWANLIVLATVFGMALIEHFFPVASKALIITDKVIIAAIAGITIQTAAIIIAAFKGLFK